MKYETRIEEGIEVRHIYAPRLQILRADLFSSRKYRKFVLHTKGNVWDLIYKNNLLQSVKLREHKFFE